MKTKTQKSPTLQSLVFKLLTSQWLVVSIIIVLIVSSSSYLAISNIIISQRQTTVLLSNITENYLDSAEHVLLALVSSNPSQKDLDTAQRVGSNLDSLYTISANGQLLAISPKDTHLMIGMDMSRHPSFETGLKGLSISKPFISQRTGNPTIYISIPVTQSDSILIGELSLAGLEKSFVGFGSTSYSESFITDEKGTFLAHPNFELVNQQERLNQLGSINQFQNGKKPQVFNDNGVWRVRVIVTIPQTGWLAITQIPLSSISKSFVLPILLGLIIFALLYFFVIRREQAVIKRQVIDPLTELSRTAYTIAKSDFTGEIRFSTTSFFSEMATLSESFINMNRAVQTRTKLLSESEEKYRLLTENASDVIWILNLATSKFTYISPSIIQLRGFTAEEAMKESLEECLTPDSLVSVREVIANNLKKFLEDQNANNYYVTQIQQPCKNGDIIWVEVSTRVRFNSTNEIEVVGVSRNIEERKKTEEEINNLNLELENKVKKRTEQLETANQEMEAFSYSISHDLRSPLRAINGYSQIIVDEYYASLDPEVVKYLDLIRKNSNTMGQLVDDLLDFSRLGKQGVKKVKVNPSLIVREVIDSMQHEISKRNIKFLVNSLPECEADPALLKQVFVNLIANAVKFTREQAEPYIEIDYTIATPPSRVNEDQKETHCYYVRDNGVGFDMKYYDKLFGVFQRLHRAEEYEGTGVGLAFVQSIITKHGGRIWADSTVGKGTTFYFTLGEKTNE